MQKPLGQLSATELAKAKQKLADLTTKVRKNAATIPATDWPTVIDKLEKGWEELKAEERRRGLTPP